MRMGFIALQCECDSVSVSARVNENVSGETTSSKQSQINFHQSFVTASSSRNLNGCRPPQPTFNFNSSTTK